MKSDPSSKNTPGSVKVGGGWLHPKQPKPQAKREHVCSPPGWMARITYKVEREQLWTCADCECTWVWTYGSGKVEWCLEGIIRGSAI